jgi:hypothetical protein
MRRQFFNLQNMRSMSALPPIRGRPVAFALTPGNVADITHGHSGLFLIAIRNGSLQKHVQAMQALVQKTS